MSETIYNIPLMTNGDMSTSLTSNPVDLSKTDGYGVEANWSGSPVGTIKLQASINNLPFVDLPGSTTGVNGPGTVIWEVTTAFYSNVQVVYTSSSGSGSLNIHVLGKGDLLS